MNAMADGFAPTIRQYPFIDSRVWAHAIVDQLSVAEFNGGLSYGEWKELALDAGMLARLAPVPYRGLQLARRIIGTDGVLDLFSGGAIIARLTPHDARYAIYTSQSFFDTTKAHRAATGVGLYDPLPARVRVRADDGFVNFVLADGHHRALVLNGRGLPILLRPDASLSSKQHYAFRNYVREHWSKL